MRARRLFVQVIKPTLAEGLLQSHLKDEWLFYLEETLAFDLCEDRNPQSCMGARIHRD